MSDYKLRQNKSKWEVVVYGSSHVYASFKTKQSAQEYINLQEALAALNNNRKLTERQVEILLGEGYELENMRTYNMRLE